MGARAVSLEELTAETTEVRGFNGRASVNCGFSLPIVLHKPTGLYCVLSVTREPGPIWSTQEEIRELEAAGRVTLLSGTERLTLPLRPQDPVSHSPEPIELPEELDVISRKQPVVVWVNENFFRNLSITEQGLVLDSLHG